MPRRKKNRLNSGLQVFIEGLEETALYALVPRPHRQGDVGFDLFVSEDTTIPPGVHHPPTDVPSGVQIKLPQGTFCHIDPRSSTYINYPTLRLCSAPIDENYTGPLNPRFQNMGTEPITIRRGERVAQFVIMPYCSPTVYVVEKLPKTNRGSKRYGSSGK